MIGQHSTPFLLMILAASLVPSVAFAAPSGGARRPEVQLLMAARNEAGGDSAASEPKPKDLTVESVLKEYFSNVECGVSSKIKKKLEKKGVSWVPSSASKEFGSILKNKVESIRGKNVRVVLHRVSVGNETLAVTGTYSYETFEPFAYGDTGQNNFVYSLDCSGYLNAALTAGVRLPAAEVAASANAAMSSAQSFSLVHAVVYSPLSAAVDRNNAPSVADKMTTRERIDILWGIHSAVVADVEDANDATNISMWRLVELIGTTRQGSSSLQGRMDMDVAGGAAAIGGSVSAGVTVSRKISFSTFDTYFIEEKTSATRVSLGELRNKILQAVSRADVPKKLSVQDRNVVTLVSLPKRICQLDWDANGLAAGQSLKVQFDAAEDACAFTIEAASASEAITIKKLSAKVVGAMGTGKDLVLEVQ